MKPIPRLKLRLTLSVKPNGHLYWTKAYFEKAKMNMFARDYKKDCVEKELKDSKSRAQRRQTNELSDTGRMQLLQIVKIML
ncbi:hypothetical protein O9G_002921 [Rozella allomycis CSF55]|uniref:Uncharacterized protein n=1 Tax=Rozella allomycis (strain CSF55) TaxID=988480 RepID=A0A075B4R7_ROZAC|nr:hypothetical protein O9G_002921 [Rozella allomycis CSF55]|eukprot:EPZ36419.1 hypothetical protein O9G_002921 [Rozella allomycis CSF55]